MAVLAQPSVLMTASPVTEDAGTLWTGDRRHSFGAIHTFRRIRIDRSIRRRGRHGVIAVPRQAGGMRRAVHAGLVGPCEVCVLQSFLGGYALARIELQQAIQEMSGEAILPEAHIQIVSPSDGFRENQLVALWPHLAQRPRRTVDAELGQRGKKQQILGAVLAEVIRGAKRVQQDRGRALIQTKGVPGPEQ
eukprot:scaffold300_cov258-Pinguiococcus_pyrenoidosus.AAC.12